MNISVTLANAGQLPQMFSKLLWRKGTRALFIIVGGVLVALNLFDLDALAHIASAIFLISYLAVQVARWCLIKQTRGSPIIVIGGFLSMAAVFGYFIGSIAVAQPWSVAVDRGVHRLQRCNRDSSSPEDSRLTPRRSYSTLVDALTVDFLPNRWEMYEDRIGWQYLRGDRGRLSNDVPGLAARCAPSLMSIRPVMRRKPICYASASLSAGLCRSSITRRRYRRSRRTPPAQSRLARAAKTADPDISTSSRSCADPPWIGLP